MNGFVTQDALIQPDLLVRPFPTRQEGPNGYLLRLAEQNCLSLADVRQLGARFETAWLVSNHLLPDIRLDPDLHAHVKRVSRLTKDSGRVWNQRRARFCPACLAEDASWQASWEVVFFDACPEHGVWMVDECSSCGQSVDWSRDTLTRCQCGSDLREEKSGLAPDSVLSLARALRARLLGREAIDEWAIFRRLDLEQLQRLIRYLGGYMDPGAGPKPLKLRSAWSLRASWPVTSLAAEILSQWPQSFHRCWSAIQARAGEGETALKGVFKHAHTYLYKGLNGGAFAPVREEFELWLTENWRGGLTKRNRNLTENLLEKAQWLPGKVAADTLGISTTRLRGLVRDGHIDGQESLSVKGRRFLVVRKDQLDQLSAQLANEMTMKDATEVLGIGKVRMRRIMKLLFPTTRRINDKISMPWCVPRSEVERMLFIADSLPRVTLPDEDQVSFGHVLRFWSWTTEEVVNLIESVNTGVLSPAAVLDTGTGLTRWVFETKAIRAWHAGVSRGKRLWATIPEAAEMMGVKQQVAYWLTQNGYIESEKLGTSKGLGSRIRREELERFRAHYVFATELSSELGPSPRKLMRLLAKSGIYPLRGHVTEACRQLVYVRDEQILRFVREFGQQSPEDFRLVVEDAS